MSDPRTNHHKFWHKERNLTKVVGRFAIAGAGGLVGVVTGHGFAITRTGQGDYLVTFTDAFSNLVNCQVGMIIISGAAVDMYAQLGVWTPGAAGAATLQIRTKTIAAVQNPADTDSVTFEATLYGEPLD